MCRCNHSKCSCTFPHSHMDCWNTCLYLKESVSINWTFLFIRRIIHLYLQLKIYLHVVILTSFTMCSTVPCYAPASVLSLPLIVTGPSVLTWVACALYNDFEESTNILKLLSNPRTDHRLIKYSRGIQAWDVLSPPCMIYTHRSMIIRSCFLPCL